MRRAETCDKVSLCTMSSVPARILWVESALINSPTLQCSNEAATLTAACTSIRCCKLDILMKAKGMCKNKQELCMHNLLKLTAQNGGLLKLNIKEI